MRLLKTLCALFCTAAFWNAAAGLAAEVTSDGYCKGVRLSGRVKVVSSFPDLKIQVVRSFPDLRVKKVSSFPDRIGEWQFVDAFEDFSIQFVNAFPDLKIQFVDAFPGVN